MDVSGILLKNITLPWDAIGPVWPDNIPATRVNLLASLSFRYFLRVCLFIFNILYLAKRAQSKTFTTHILIIAKIEN